jgi:NAD(P)-dependent dehydrogenase (short-subunit alcohol dehydrogenase family)
VVIASRKLGPCQLVAGEIERETGVTAIAHAVHVGRWEDAPPLIDAAYARFGRLDVLVNNAGMSPPYPDLEAVTEDLFDKVIAVNLRGPFRLSVLAGGRMAAAEGGSIINISSVAAVRPRPDMLPYASAKAGLNALTAGLAHAFGPSVRCNAIMAGTFLTDISKSWDLPAFAERAKTFALGRGGQPDEIVGACLYLASDASSYTTGTVMTVDGGLP